MPERIDKLMVARGLAASRTQAQSMIAGQKVHACLQGLWVTIDRPSLRLDASVALRAEATPEMRYVSRAGLKLAAALQQLTAAKIMAGPSATCAAGITALDVGQSTGGFTDCLLQHGASRVVGVDVGQQQLAPSVRAHTAVVCHEGVNARELPAALLLQDAPQGFDWVVMDVSFISQTLILPRLGAVMCDDGLLISLVKPQFELQPQDIGKGGLVLDEQCYPRVQQRVTDCLVALGFEPLTWFESAITGGDGNREFFIAARYHSNRELTPA